MQIVINGWFLAQHAASGSGQYVRALLEWLPRVAPQHSYRVVTPAPVQLDGIPVEVVRCGSQALSKVYFEQVLFPSACQRLGAEVAHIPYWAPPLRSPAPLVVTIHDVIPRILPHYRGNWRVQLYTALVSAAAQGAAVILADSDASRRDIVTHLAVPETRVRTVLLAAEPRYTPRADGAADEAARARYGLPPEGGYVLYLGGYDIRKNVRGLLSAWTWAAGSIGEAYPLVLAGALPTPDGELFEDFPALAQELGLTSTVKFIGAVAEADKPALYRGATVFAYPSRYEGFGLPPLEAMACGVPVAASSAASLPEVVGSAGYLIPPDDTRTLGAALLTCVVEPSVADELRVRSLEQAARFSWEHTARATVEAYEAAAHG